MRPTSKSGILGVFMSAALGLSCSLVDLRLNAESDCTSQPATFCTRLNDSQPPSDACQSWTCNKATRFCELGPRDLDADGAIDPNCAPSGSTLPLDCDDNDPKRFPNNPEVCDFLDNDCNSLTDENVYTVFDELTNDPQSFIPDTCPDGAITCTEGEQLPESGTISSNGLAFASRPEPNDPQVLSAFIRPVEETGLLGATLFDTTEWRFLASADIDPVYQPNQVSDDPSTLFGEFNATAVALTPLNDFFAVAATGKITNNAFRAADGIVDFKAPPKAHIEKSHTTNDVDVDSLPIITGIGERALVASMSASDPPVTLQLVYVDSSGTDCSIDAPCLTTGSSASIGTPTVQVPAVVGIDGFGWLIAVVHAGNDKTGYLTIHHVQADQANALSSPTVMFSEKLSDTALSNIVLAKGSSSQLAIGYTSGERVEVALLNLDTSANPSTLSIEHTLDLSSLPGTAHHLPNVIWQPLRDEWILGVLETSADPARLFVMRFTQDAVLLDAAAVQIFGSRNLQSEIGFHFKPIENGLVILGYQLSGSGSQTRGNVIASKFGCSTNIGD